MKGETDVRCPIISSLLTAGIGLVHDARVRTARGGLDPQAAAELLDLDTHPRCGHDSLKSGMWASTRSFPVPPLPESTSPHEISQSPLSCAAAFGRFPDLTHRET